MSCLCAVRTIWRNLSCTGDRILGCLQARQEPKCRCRLQKKDGWDSDAESIMQGFMLPQLHSSQSADAAAKDAQKEQCTFRYPEFLSSGPRFVQPEQEKSRDVQRG